MSGTVASSCHNQLLTTLIQGKWKCCQVGGGLLLNHLCRTHTDWRVSKDWQGCAKNCCLNFKCRQNANTMISNLVCLFKMTISISRLITS